MDSGVNISVHNTFPFLTFAGLNPHSENFVELSLQHITESGLDVKTLTNGFVLELGGLLESKDPDQPANFGSISSPKKITRRQFAEIIGCFLFGFSKEEITRAFIKQVCYPRDLKNLKHQVDQGLSEHDAWKVGYKVVERVEKKRSLEASVDKGGDVNQQQENTSSKQTSDNLTPQILLQAKSIEKSIVEDSVDMEDHVDDYEDTFGMPPIVDEVTEKNKYPSLFKVGLLDLSGSISILQKLADWEPDRESVTNGVIIELFENFWDKSVRKILVRKLIKLLNIHDSHLCWSLESRFSKYIERTKPRSSDLDEPWEFFQCLQPGGKLFKSELLKPQSRFDETVQNLTNLAEQLEKTKTCSECSDAGDFFCCQGCFLAFYCSEICQKLHWSRKHNLECSRLASNTMKEGAKLPPTETPSVSLVGKYRKSLQMVQNLAGQVEILEKKLIESENEKITMEEELGLSLIEKMELREECAVLKEALQRLKKEKAGKSSAFIRMKRKFEEIEETDDNGYEETRVRNKSSQTSVTVKLDKEFIIVAEDTTVQMKSIEILNGKEGKSEGSRHYGESTYVRLPSSRSAWPNDKVSTRAVQGRAAVVKDFISMISGSESSVSKEESDRIEKLLFIQLVKQNKAVFISILRSNPEVLGIIMKMTPEETSKFMHASNSSYSSKRKMATMFSKIYQFNPLAGEKKQRVVEKAKQTLVERSKLDHGAMLLHKTAKSEYSTLCAFVRVSDLSLFFSELHSLAIAQEVPDQSSMKNLEHPLYFGKLWILISGDKGSSTMKFVAGLGGHDPHLFALFEASDTPENLLLFQSKYIEEIRKLVAFGIDLTQADGSTKTVEVEIVVCGDKAFISDENGHAGASASFPSYYTLVTREHLRKKHLDGSPHNLANPDCHFPIRTPEGLDRDYHQNLNDSRSGTLNSRGKHHNSIVGPRLLPLPSQLHFAVSSLHISLMFGLRMIGYIEVDCDIIDGTKTKDDLAGIETRFDILEGLTAEASDDDDQVSEQGGDDALSEIMQENHLQREMLEVQWQTKSLDVIDAELEEKNLSEKICEKLSILKRIELIENGDFVSVEKIAKKLTKARYSLKSFRKCDMCLLTGFDREILWRTCSICQKRIHLFCQVYSDQEIALDDLQCRACSGVTTLGEIRENISLTLSELKASAPSFSSKLASLRKQESHLKQQCSNFMGVTRLRLKAILEEKLSVNRADYHSACFVGNHVDIIMDRYGEITEVFSSNPDVKKKYDEFFEVYKPLHFLMKACRFLTPAELDLVDLYCEKLGEIYPRNFKTSIPPKLDDLIFTVPKFARRWNTIGGLREEKIEAFHNIVRQKDLKLVQMMERCEVKMNMVMDFAKASPRSFLCPVCKESGRGRVVLVEKICPSSGFVKIGRNVHPDFEPSI